MAILTAMTAAQQDTVLTIVILIGLIFLGALFVFFIIKNIKRLRVDKYTVINDVTNLNDLLHLIDYRIKSSKNDIYFTLLLISIDDFDHLKDFINPDNVKEYLHKVTSAIRKTLPIGGKMAETSDEESFLIYLPEYYDEERRQEIAQEFKDSVEKKFIVRDTIPLQKSASVAITTYPEQGESVIDLVNNLLVAVYSIKKNGGNDLIFYSKEMEEQIKYIDRYQEIRELIANDRISITFNPIMDKARNKLTAVSSIIRRTGESASGDFISYLEESGDDFWFTIWSLEKSILINMDIIRSDYVNDFHIILPVGYKFIMNANAAYKLQSSLEKYNIALNNIVLEIDDILDRDRDNNLIKSIMQIQGAGIRIATNVRNADRELTKIIETYDIDFIKFRVDEIINNNKWVSNLIKIAHNYRKKIIITGVENEEQVNFLKSKEISYIEGPYFGSSLTKDKIDDMIINK